MSQVLQASVIQKFSNDPTILTMIGKDSSSNPAVFPYHQRDADERVPYPHITIARFGDITERGIFQDGSNSTIMDGPRIAICVWSLVSLDEAYNLYNAADILLRGNNANISSQFFSTYKIRRTHLRDDLFDNTSKAFHIHSEYSMWLQYTQT